MLAIYLLGPNPASSICELKASVIWYHVYYTNLNTIYSFYKHKYKFLLEKLLFQAFLNYFSQNKKKFAKKIHWVSI